MANPETSIFDEIDKEAEKRRYAEAVADVAAGRLIPNDEICAWLETWGTPEEKPPPASWFK
jgi:predicted transcriptional regulator